MAESIERRARSNNNNLPKIFDGLDINLGDRSARLDPQGRLGEFEIKTRIGDDGQIVYDFVKPDLHVSISVDCVHRVRSGDVYRQIHAYEKTERDKLANKDPRGRSLSDREQRAVEAMTRRLEEESRRSNQPQDGEDLIREKLVSEPAPGPIPFMEPAW